MARYRSTRKTPMPPATELTNVVQIRAAQRKRSPSPKNAAAETVSTEAVAGSNEQPVVGPNEQAVIEQCAQSGMTEQRPATVMQARTMARILDDAARMHDHPKASDQLHKLLTSLDPPRKRKTSGRLSSVKAMSGTGIRRAQ